MRQSLLWKLLGVNVLVIAFVISVVWLAINYLAAGYFVILMEKYHISPAASHQMFVSAVHRYLIWASVAAFVLAVAERGIDEEAAPPAHQNDRHCAKDRGG